MLLMIQNYGTTPMTQIIQNKSTNSQIRFVQIHKYTKISTNTTKYLIKCSSKHNVREIAPWHYPHVPGNPPKIHKFTNPICTNPQIRPNEHKYTEICTNTHNQEEMAPCCLWHKKIVTDGRTEEDGHTEENGKLFSKILITPNHCPITLRLPHKCHPWSGFEPRIPKWYNTWGLQVV